MDDFRGEDDGGVTPNSELYLKPRLYLQVWYRRHKKEKKFDNTQRLGKTTPSF